MQNLQISLLQPFIVFRGDLSVSNLFGKLSDGYTQWVLTVPLCQTNDGCEQLVGTHPLCYKEHHMGHLWLAMGQCSSLVKHNRLDLVEK